MILAEIVYDGELSGTAYAVLSVALVVIVGGLAWCFYRALKASDVEAPAQLPDDGQSP